MATLKLVFLIGAGLAGSIVVKNGRVSDFVSDISKVFTKHLKEDDDSGNNTSDFTSISAQVQRLTYELRQLTNNRSITVVNGGPNQSSNLSSLAMPVVVVGVVGYGYFWWKGWSWTDVMYVTRRNMANVVNSVSKQLEQVTAAVSATKRHLASRIDGVERTLDESKAVQGIIKNEVFEIRGDVSRIGGDIVSVQQVVEGLGVQLGEVQTKQDFTNQGIILLCQFAKRWEETSRRPDALPNVDVLKLQGGTSGSIGNSNPVVNGLLQGFSMGRLERSVSATVTSGSGLKELQFIAETLGSGTTGPADSPPQKEKDVPVATGNIGSSFRRSLGFSAFSQLYR